MSNPYQTPPPDPYGSPYGGQGGQPYGSAPGYGTHPGYGQPGYGYPVAPQPLPYGAAPVPTGEQNSLAMASVALGFVSILICFYGGLLGPVALGLGIAGVNKSRTTGTGRSTAIGGIVLGALSILISIAALIFFVVLNKSTSSL
ncbi:DUF4190 domain-containing protein [Peterkaempfera griseoplana]|uniref:DUF4190 domain-containing protein n=1 Tax=Peterkaempfera griseoplana TaxID=66896 RepID=UPI0006E38C3C|nr:DUF4190 domain-containing protein [Peterkaempfera griseoplana]